MKRVLYLLLSIIILVNCDLLTNKKIITQGVRYLPLNFDKPINLSIDEMQIFTQMYETLLSLDNDYITVKPNLVEKWEISADKRSYTFHIRPDVFFHDNSMLRIDDIIYSIQTQILTVQDSYLRNSIESIDILDSLSFSIKLKSPYSQFLFELSSPCRLLIVSKNRKNQFIAFPPGTGPFKLKRIKEKEYIHLTANERYWDEHNYIDEVHFQIYEDKIKLEKSILNDEVDLIYVISSYSTDRLKWLGSVDYFVQKPIGTAFLGFNNDNPPFNDLRVRKAIFKALNIPKLVNYVNRGNATVAKGPLPTTFYQYENEHPPEQDIEEAKRLLKEAGYSDLTIKFYFPKVGFVKQTIIEMLKYDLEKINVSLVVVLYNSWDEHDSAIKSDTSQLFLDLYGSEVIGEPGNFLYSLFHSKSIKNTLHYQNTHVDTWLDAAQKESNSERRKHFYQKIMNTIHEDTPAVFLYHLVPHFAYNKTKIKSLYANPYELVQYQHIILHE